MMTPTRLSVPHTRPLPTFGAQKPADTPETLEAFLKVLREVRWSPERMPELEMGRAVISARFAKVMRETYKVPTARARSMMDTLLELCAHLRNEKPDIGSFEPNAVIGFLEKLARDEYNEMVRLAGGPKETGGHYGGPRFEDLLARTGAPA